MLLCCPPRYQVISRQNGQNDQSDSIGDYNGSLYAVALILGSISAFLPSLPKVGCMFHLETTSKPRVIIPRAVRGLGASDNYPLNRLCTEHGLFLTSTTSVL